MMLSIVFLKFMYLVSAEIFSRLSFGKETMDVFSFYSTLTMIKGSKFALIPLPGIKTSVFHLIYSVDY